MPVIKLTKSTIDKIPHTKNGQVLYHDQTLKGFMLRVGKSTKTYCACHMVKGQARQITIGRHGVFTPEQARNKAKEHLYLMAQDIDPKEDARKKATKNMTLLDLVDDFLSVRMQLKPKTKKDYKYFVEKYLSDWVNKPVTNITEKMFLDRYLKIGQSSGHATANNVRRYLGSLLNYGLVAHGVLDHNPVGIIRKTRSAYPDKRRSNVINPSDLKVWWEAVGGLDGDIMGDYLKLVLLTGLRRSEAACLKWDDINFNERTLTITDTKNGEPLTIPIGNYLFGLLQRRFDRIGGDQVFPSTAKQGYIAEPKKAVARVRAACDVKFTVHDLRRTYMTIAASLDISAYALKRLVNHKMSHDVTGGYIVLGIEQLRDPVQKIENYILEQVGEKRTGD